MGEKSQEAVETTVNCRCSRQECNVLQNYEVCEEFTQVQLRVLADKKSYIVEAHGELLTMLAQHHPPTDTALMKGPDIADLSFHLETKEIQKITHKWLNGNRIIVCM